MSIELRMLERQKKSVLRKTIEEKKLQHPSTLAKEAPLTKSVVFSSANSLRML